MTVSFQTFRDRYPTASMTSEVVLVQSDRFVVKVTVATDSAGCATGLAAHPSVEVAEDRARHRALEAGGWLPDDQPSQPLTEPPAESNGATPAPVAPAADTEPTPVAPSTPLTAKPSPAPAVPPSSPAPPKVPEPASQAASVTTPPRRTAAAPKPPAPEPAAIATPPPPAVTPPASPEPAPSEAAPIEAATLPAPINLSDVIAQTDIELRRLGWSVEAGREYLERTYQKRSRHELSEEELIQFLCHLESL